jgi:hypothetical protein
MAKFEVGDRVRIVHTIISEPELTGRIAKVINVVDGGGVVLSDDLGLWAESRLEPIDSPQQVAAPCGHALLGTCMRCAIPASLAPSFSSKVERETYEARVPPTLIPDLRAENATLRSEVERLTKERDQKARCFSAACNDAQGTERRIKAAVAEVANDRDFWRREAQRIMPATEFKRLVAARERNR